ncbi:MAG: DUF2341 domain-containing protein [Candidatus Thermoplasmatota archaeon]
MKLFSQFSKTRLSTIGSNVWEDTFEDTTKIDFTPPGEGITDNILVSDGKVTMQNTIPAWTDPTFTKMKSILLNNPGPQRQNHVIKLSIPYDSDMQPDFRDIRFKHQQNPTTWLAYWIEYKNTTTAIVWVKIITLPAGQSILYLFYGKPDATSTSNFNNVFSGWSKKWTNDIQISNQPSSQSAEDADVAYGNNRYLVCWDEGTTSPPYYRGIEGKIFDPEGNVVVNTFVIQENPGSPYRYENPSAAYGGGRFFVAYNYFATPIDPSSQDVHARLVSTQGTIIGSEIIVSSQTNRQMNPHVSFDSVNNRFCVIWQDARNGVTDYNLYAKFYDTSGTQIGGEKTICSLTNSQLEPWSAFDPITRRYLIVWEDGVDASSGPFDIYAGLFDSNLNLIGNYILVADGTTSVDYNWPAVGFSETTKRYLVAWSQSDISSGDYYGNIWGKIYDANGNLVVNTFQIAAGEYVRTDVQPFLSSSYLVTYDSGNKIYGKLIGPNGELITSEIQICSSSGLANWANTAGDLSKVFVGWEDKRLSSTYKYIFGNILNLTTRIAPDVTYTFGDEQTVILTAHVTSIPIQPAELNTWRSFAAVFSGSITYDILDGITGSLLIQAIPSGGSLESITASSIRLKATLTRAAPSTSPALDTWNVTWQINNPPNVPSAPSPSNGAPRVGFTPVLSWIGGDPDVGDTVTYDVYFGSVNPPTKQVSNQTGTTYTPGLLNQGTTYYWRVVAWDDHQASTSGDTWFFTTNYPPYQPSNPFPVNHATDIDVTVVISWIGGDPDVGDTVTYDVYFGSVNPPTKQVSNQTGTTYTPGTLQYLTTYYWKVVAWDALGCSTSSIVWDFTTLYVPNNPPYQPSNPLPNHHAEGVAITADLSWSGGDPDPYDTVSYDVYFGTTNPPPLLVIRHPFNTYDLGILMYNTTYYWKIVAWDNRGASATGPLWDFTTVEELNLPPYLPSDPNPPNHADNVSITISLSWTGGDPNQADTVTYDVYFGSVNPPPKKVSNSTTSQYAPGILAYETVYYWRVIAWDSHQLSTVGALWDFTTESFINYPPSKPTNPQPSDGATNVSPPVTLSWSADDPNPDDTVLFDLYFGTSMPVQKIASNLTQSSYQLGSVAYNTTYYWKIFCKDIHGAVTEGDTWRFTTLRDTNPPSITIKKPEKALYIMNKKILSFPVPCIIGTIDVDVEVTDQESGVDRVEFYLDGILQQTSTTPPYRWTWSVRSFFFYYITIVAYDVNNNSRTSEVKVWKFF